jgi:hypothetical protein
MRVHIGIGMQGALSLLISDFLTASEPVNWIGAAFNSSRAHKSAAQAPSVRGYPGLCTLSSGRRERLS